jgi:hypothetical protein
MTSKQRCRRGDEEKKHMTSDAAGARAEASSTEREPAVARRLDRIIYTAGAIRKYRKAVTK